MQAFAPRGERSQFFMRCTSISSDEARSMCVPTEHVQQQNLYVMKRHDDFMKRTKAAPEKYTVQPRGRSSLNRRRRSLQQVCRPLRAETKDHIERLFGQRERPELGEDVLGASRASLDALARRRCAHVLRVLLAIVSYEKEGLPARDSREELSRGGCDEGRMRS